MFVTGGQAWQACRNGYADPNVFGPFGDNWGWEFIMDNVVRDFLALNKIEILPWDGWGWMEKKKDELIENEVNLLDFACPAL